MFDLAPRLSAYPLMGLGINLLDWEDDDDDDESGTRVTLYLGGGAEFYLSKKWKAQVEAKYQMGKDLDGLEAVIGIAYVW